MKNPASKYDHGDGMKDPYAIASDVLNRHKKEIMAIPGVHGVGVGKGSNYGGDASPCLIAYLDTNTDGKEIPSIIEDIPVFIVRTEKFESL